MTPASDKRKEEALNIITKWVVSICLPTILGIGLKLIWMISSANEAQAATNQRLINLQENQRRQQIQTDIIDGRLTQHITHHPGGYEK